MSPSSGNSLDLSSSSGRRGSVRAFAITLAISIAFFSGSSLFGDDGSSSGLLRSTSSDASVNLVSHSDKSLKQPPRYSDMSRTEQIDWLYSSAGQHHLSVLQLPDDGLAPFTKETQQLIYNHQNRPAAECAKARFITSSWIAGLGSQWHVATHHLAMAMLHGKIFLWSKSPKSAGALYTNREVCGDDPSWECYLRSPSNCSAWATPDNTENKTMMWGDEADQKRVPEVLSAKLRAAFPDVTADEVRYWWRGQGAAYLARLNDRTIAAVAELRKMRQMAQLASALPPDDSAASNNATLYPLPRGTTSAHVRHGDKGYEMALIDWDRYADAAVALQETHPFTLRRSLFVSTEDPAVISQARSKPAPPWRVFYSDIPRENSNGQDQMRLDSRLVHKHLLQLLMALECDAFVGTVGSNWNRLINEFRCIWVPKCGAPYAEVGNRGDWQGYGWRRR